MNLAIDIGNTRMKIGVFNDNLLIEKAKWADWTLKQLTELIQKYTIENVIFSSVVENDKEVKAYLSKNFKFLELTAATQVPFRNQYQTPETLGKDRLAAVAGSYFLFRGQNAISIDCGTCIKYDIITADGVYLGGNIAPGLEMRLKAMNHFTARLPMVEMRLPAENIGKNTEAALQNGALRGAFLEVEGYANEIKSQMGRARAVLTGGDADLVSKNIKVRGLYVEPNLVLIGLNQILRYNIKRGLL